VIRRPDDNPAVCRTYKTEDGLVYYVLSITTENSKMTMKYLVISNESVNPRDRVHMMDVGEIGDFTGPVNLAWMDERLA